MPPLSEKTAALAHDAANLLAALGLYADLLASPGVLRRQHRHYAEELRILSARAGALLGRITHPQHPFRALQEGDASAPAGLGWGESAAAVLRTLRPVLERIAGRRVDLEIVCAEDVRLPLPTEALERIVVNLVRNSAAALAQKPRPLRRPRTIRVEAEQTSEAVTLRVVDNGPGMETYTAARFLRPATGPDERGPQGMGHRIVHELTEGAIREIRIQPGGGTSISFTWPAIPVGSVLDGAACVPGTVPASGGSSRC